MSEVWVVVADSRHVRIFSAAARDAPLREIASIDHAPTAPATLDFAGELARHLEANRIREQFRRLYVAAPPGFHRDLRAALAPATAATVSRAYEQNWVAEDPTAIRAHLPADL